MTVSVLTIGLVGFLLLVFSARFMVFRRSDEPVDCDQFTYVEKLLKHLIGSDVYVTKAEEKLFKMRGVAEAGNPPQN